MDRTGGAPKFQILRNVRTHLWRIRPCSYVLIILQDQKVEHPPD